MVPAAGETDGLRVKWLGDSTSEKQAPDPARGNIGDDQYLAVRLE